MVERLFEDQGVGGSIPSPSTTLSISFSQKQSFLGRLVFQTDGCIVFVGSRDRRGYGRFRVGSAKDGSRKLVKAHRLAFYLAHGWLPIVVRHSCDNPACCNVSHLLAGTQLDNMVDMDERGRRNAQGATGIKNRHAVLREEDVRAIRGLLPSFTNVEIATRFGVNHGTISLIRRGKTWTHVE